MHMPIVGHRQLSRHERLSCHLTTKHARDGGVHGLRAAKQPDFKNFKIEQSDNFFN